MPEAGGSVLGGAGARASAGEADPAEIRRRRLGKEDNYHYHKVHTYVEYRAVSRVFQNIDPPPPLSTRRVCPPPATKAGVHTRRAERGVEGSIFWKTQDIGLASYSNNLSTPGILTF
jgi:hypothetical protein